VADPKNGAVEKLTDRQKLVQQFATLVQGRAELDASFDAQEIAEAQLATILRAKNEDELFAAMELAGVSGLRDMEDGAEIEIRGYRFLRGMNEDFANRLGVYVIMDCVSLETGAEFPLNTGIERIIGFLRMVESGDAGLMFPVSVRIKKSTTASGNTMVTFKRLSKRAVPSTTA